MTDVFVSYSQKDRSSAQQLAHRLSESGYEVWWDALLRGGAQYRKEIQQAIYSSKAAIVIWSASSATSDWVIDEAEESKRLNKLIPTRVENFPIESVPYGFRQLQTIDVSNLEAIEQSIRGFGAVPTKKSTTSTSTIAGASRVRRRSWPWSSSPRAHRHAFLLGNTDYTSVERFIGADNDARALAHKLTELGFDTSLSINLGRADALESIESFTKKLKTDDTALLFYAGHGLQIDGVNYLVPVDATFQTENPISELISLRSSVDGITARARTLLVFLDATRPNPFSKEQVKRLEGALSEISQSSSKAFGLVEAGLSHFGNRPGKSSGQSYILFASLPGEPGHHYEDGRGLFVETLNRHIGTRGLQLEDMADRVARDLRTESETIGGHQEVWRETNMKEAFYFNPPTLRPMLELGLLGLLAGLLTCVLLIDERAEVRDPTLAPWLWALGLPFGLVVGYGILRWGSGRWLHAAVALIGTMAAFALALLLVQTRVTPGGDQSVGPIELSLLEQFFFDARKVAITLLALLSGMSMSAGVGLGCKPQGGSFRDATAGLIGVGVVMMGVVSMGFLALNGMMPLPINVLMIFAGALWFATLGAYLGYRFSKYVPEHPSTLLSGAVGLFLFLGMFLGVVVYIFGSIVAMEFM